MSSLNGKQLLAWPRLEECTNELGTSGLPMQQFNDNLEIHRSLELSPYESKKSEQNKS